MRQSEDTSRDRDSRLRDDVAEETARGSFQQAGPSYFHTGNYIQLATYADETFL